MQNHEPPTLLFRYINVSVKISLWPLMSFDKMKVAPGQKRLGTTGLHARRRQGRSVV